MFVFIVECSSDSCSLSQFFVSAAEDIFNNYFNKFTSGFFLA